LVGAYRLIGYENRALEARDFNDDKKDAGEVGAGHSVTALYEVVPVGAHGPGASSVDPLKYQTAAPASAAAQSDELMTLKIRYKPPGTEKSQLSTYVVRDDGKSFEAASSEHRFSAGVAAFGMKLKDSPHVKGLSLAETRKIVESALGTDTHGERRELVKLIDKAAALPR
jgi:Ca-activated chloride channel family protein